MLDDKEKNSTSNRKFKTYRSFTSKNSANNDKSEALV